MIKSWRKQMLTIEEIEAQMNIAEKQDELKANQNTRFIELSKMSFVKRMQEPENIMKLKRLEEEQKRVFKIIINRRHKHLLPELDDLFAQFFIDFLGEDVRSINDFLYKELGQTEDANLKDIYKA